MLKRRKIQIGQLPQNILCTIINIGQYNCIKQTASSDNIVSNIPYKMHMFMFSLDPTLGFMQFLELLNFLEYRMGVEHEGGRNAGDRRSIFDVI